MLFMAPMAPAEHPPKSSLASGCAPMPLLCSRSVMVAATMRAPRNEYPNVASLAPTSPLQKSLLQYLRRTSV